MNIACNDRQRIFTDGTPEEWAALEIHSATCVPCANEMQAWKNLSLTAAELHQEWDSPSLWPRIEQALSQQSLVMQNSWWRRFRFAWIFGSLQWQTVAAALIVITLTASSIWFLNARKSVGITGNQSLLNDSAITDVEHAEAAYERAIDKLDAKARPQLANSSAPLMANYREKLLVIDSAIADLKSQAGINPANGHLRRELLAMYREKQDTLEQILEVKQ